MPHFRPVNNPRPIALNIIDQGFLKLPDSWYAGAPGGAVFSRCRRYRYLLWRRWSAGPSVLFVALNPNRADAEHTDPTIRRMMGFAADWGYGACLVANLFSIRASTPAALSTRRGPVGRATDPWIVHAREQVALTVACWGNHGRLLGRGREVATWLKPCHVLRLTGTGEPAHPLYLPGRLKPVPWE